ncbi:hypothetical protein [Helicobacter suis]|uniref:hypothetical protein n=1 Tax=Helicobacter suis TaxID=104628 RepID=UPI0013D6DFF7|nr:hypothetical protein [Helicobacter suis]
MLRRISLSLGLLLLLVHLCLGEENKSEPTEFEPPRVVKLLRNQYEDFDTKKLKLNLKKRKPVEETGEETGEGFPFDVFEENKAHVGKTLYRGFVLHTYKPGVEEINDHYRGNIKTSSMCFGFLEGSKWHKGFCLDLNPVATFSQISLNFKKDVFILRINEWAVECDWEHRSLDILIFKPVGDRYILQAYSRVNDTANDIDPFYRQKRDGKQIFMDQIDNDVLQDLENHCYKKHYCQTYDEKNGIN